MEQIPLDVQLADHAVFDTWLAGDNGALVHALHQVATMQTFTVCWLWGAAESGKTHLLQACVNEAHRHQFRTAYLPVGPGSELEPGVVENMGDLDVICIDEIDTIAGRGEWEQAMFGLFEGIRQHGSRLVMAAEKPPLHCAYALPDLISRFSSGATFRVHPLSDDDKIKAMQLRARWRGLALPDDVARFLYSRVARGNRFLFDMLERLDKKALVEQKRLTIPFVRAFLAEDKLVSDTNFAHQDRKQT
jgi:DnaA family protein